MFIRSFRQRGVALAQILIAAAAIIILSGAAFGLSSTYFGGATRANKGQITADLLQRAVTTLIAEAGTDQDGIPLPPAGATIISGLTGSETPAGGWEIPVSSKAPKRDGYGSLIGYCSWNHGSSNGGTGYFQGGSANITSVPVAVISAGLDRQFQTNCTQAKTGIANGDDAIRFLSLGAAQQIKNGASDWLDPVDCFNATTPVNDILNNAANCVASSSRIDLLSTVGLRAGTLVLAKKSGAIYQWYGGAWNIVGGSASGGYNASGFKSAVFTALNGVERNTLFQSNSVQVNGIGNAILVTVVGGSYAISSDNTTWGAWQTVPGAISNGQYLKLQQTSSTQFSTTTTATISLGGVSQSWNVSTRAPITVANPFSFSPVTGAAKGQYVASNTVTVTGIEVPVALSASGETGTSPQCNVNSAGFGDCSGTIAPNSTLQVRQITSLAETTTTKITVTVGALTSADFSATTGGQYIEDVFAAYPYTAAGFSPPEQDIRTGIDMLGSDTAGVADKFKTTLYKGKSSPQSILTGQDLSGYGGMVWTKDRDLGRPHGLYDTARGAGRFLVSNTLDAETYAADTLSSFGTNGFSVGADLTYGPSNVNGEGYAAWTFRRAPKWFDVVTWTGDGSNSRSLAHGLGIEPGFIIVKKVSANQDWTVWHRSLGVNENLSLNLNAPKYSVTDRINGPGVAPTASTFTAGTSINTAGDRFVAYVFAHDTAADGLVQAGSYTGNGIAAGPDVSLGWKPQWVLIKNSTGAENWVIHDSTRGIDKVLHANSSVAESSIPGMVDFTPTGFKVTSGGGARWNSGGQTYIYLAIRAPSFSNKGLVWTKWRDQVSEHVLVDTVTGTKKALDTASALAQKNNVNTITRFNSDGYTTGNYMPSGSAVSWSFKAAPKFFDVVTWTGDGTAGRVISHSLGGTVGMATVKAVTTDPNYNWWWVYHRGTSNPSAYGLRLNTTDSQGTVGSPIVNPTNTTIQLAGNNTNAIGVQYVAYLFAHDSSADGLIQCGSYAAPSIGGTAAITLGWEPQLVLVKPSSATGNWVMMDNSRGFSMATQEELYTNTSGAQVTRSTPAQTLTATGFTDNGQVYGAGTTMIYMAIRRGPMKPPTSGTQVYNAIARAGTSASANVTGVGFPVDLHLVKQRNGGQEMWFTDRMRGSNKYLFPSIDYAERTASSGVGVSGFDLMDGLTLGTATNINDTAYSYINYFFRRYPQVFDIVGYTGTSVARTVAHNLGVAPELMIVKRRDGADKWYVYSKSLNTDQYLALNETTTPATWAALWNGARPTDSIFSLGATGQNGNGLTYVAYLFASSAGISKVGTYSGSSSDVNVDLGFTGPPRFVLIRRRDGAGNWTVFDSERGILNGGNDPMIQVNSTAAEVTGTNNIEPTSVGFTAKTGNPDVNVSGASYLYLAIR